MRVLKSILVLSLLFCHFFTLSQTKVFILAGQSNMEGYGQVHGLEPGTLERAVGEIDSLGHLISGNSWNTFPGCWIHYNEGNTNLKVGDLSIGFGKEDKIGPELGFGTVMDEYYDDQILVIKAAYGGRSIYHHFRSPSSGSVGDWYTLMIDDIQEALDDLPLNFPQYDSTEGYEIVGFGWHQGWSDADSREIAEQYSVLLANFIRDIRVDLAAPDMKVVIANSGFGGCETIQGNIHGYRVQSIILPAQNGIPFLSEFNGNVGVADTRSFWRDRNNSPLNALLHWNENGLTYYQIGYAMAKRMIGLIEGQVPNFKVQLFPNPSGTHITLHGVPKCSEVLIYDAMGKEVLSKRLCDSKLDISMLSNGHYQVKIFDQTLPFVKF